jgi:integrase
MPPAKPSRREYGTGSITWLSPRRARLRIRVPGETGQRTKVVRVAPKDKGGIGEAKAELERFVAELAVGTPTERTTVTVSEMLEAYLAHCKRVGRTQSTIESYGYSTTRVPAALGSLPLTQLTSHHLDTLYGELAERLGDNTIRQTHAILTAALEQALKWGWIEDNPAKGATAPGRHRPKRKALALTDIARMVAAASTPRKNETDGDVVLAMAIAMAALTGARRGELCGMQWSDIDPATCSITIERQWVPGKGGQYLAPPKSEDGVRSIVLGQLGLGLIERYRDIMREMLRREPEGWLLSYDAGATPLRAKALGQAIAGLGKGSASTSPRTPSGGCQPPNWSPLASTLIRPVVGWVTPKKSCWPPTCWEPMTDPSLPRRPLKVASWRRVCPSETSLAATRKRRKRDVTRLDQARRRRGECASIHDLGELPLD